MQLGLAAARGSRACRLHPPYHGPMAGRKGLRVLLVTDLVGSTELRSGLGEEEAEELRRTHDRLLAEAVEGAGGEVVKGVGDGVLAAFETASGAAEAARAIQAVIAAHARAGGEALGVRVGLAAGEVSFESGDVFGLPVVAATRLCNEAAGGQILAADIVRSLASDEAARFTPVGDLELKGIDGRVTTFELAWEDEEPPPAMPRGLVTSEAFPFVARQGERRALREAFEAAASGERRMVVLAGDAGVGKTRLALETARDARARGFLVLPGRCDEGLGVPYQPIVEALDAFVDTCSGEDLAERVGPDPEELARIFPALKDELPELPPTLSADPETERYRLFEAAVGWLEAASTTQPIVLIVDDLQWATRPTAQMLRHIVRAARSMRLLLLATVRDTGLSAGHPVAELLADLRRDAAFSRLDLSGLDETGTKGLVAAAAGHDLDDRARDLARALHRTTGGNPFFAAEVLLHLVETGVVYEQDGRWTSDAADPSRITLPESVKDVVERRLNRLSDVALDVLRAGAVAGSEFDHAVVSEASGVEPTALPGAVEEILSTGLLEERPGPRLGYSFAHALVASTILEGLPVARRAELHRLTAEAIEAVRAPRLDEHAAELAHHHAEAARAGGDPTRAIEWLSRAGEAAAASHAREEAAEHYERALDLADLHPAAIDLRGRCELAVALAEAEAASLLAIYGAPGRRRWLEAARMALELDDTDLLVRAVMAAPAGLIGAGLPQEPEVIVLLEEALVRMPSDDSPARAPVLAKLAVALVDLGDPGRIDALVEEALAVARHLGDPATLCDTLALALSARWRPDTLDWRRRISGEQMALAEELGDPSRGSYAAFWCFLQGLEGGDREAVDAARAEHEGRWHEGVPKAASLLMGFTLDAMEGRISEAERRAAEHLELAGSSPDALATYAVHLYLVRWEQGRLDELLTTVEEVADEAVLPAWRASLALAYAIAGRVEEPRRIIDELAKTGFDVPLDGSWTTAMLLLAETMSQAELRDHAEDLYERILPFGDRCVATGAFFAGSLRRSLGELAVLMGRHDTAIEHFRTANVVHQRMCTPTWHARTQVGWARALFACGGEADAHEARALLADALGAARELGLGGIERDATELLARSETRPPDPDATGA